MLRYINKLKEIDKSIVNNKLNKILLSIKYKIGNITSKKRYCPIESNPSRAKSMGVHTGDPTVCSECGECFGIYDSNIRNNYQTHINYSYLPHPIYKLSHRIKSYLYRI